MERALDHGCASVAGKALRGRNDGFSGQKALHGSDEGVLANAAADSRYLRFAGAIVAARKPPVGTYEVFPVGHRWQWRPASAETGPISAAARRTGPRAHQDHLQQGRHHSGGPAGGRVPGWQSSLREGRPSLATGQQATFLIKAGAILVKAKLSRCQVENAAAHSCKRNQTDVGWRQSLRLAGPDLQEGVGGFGMTFQQLSPISSN